MIVLSLTEPQARATYEALRGLLDSDDIYGQTRKYLTTVARILGNALPDTSDALEAQFTPEAEETKPR